MHEISKEKREIGARNTQISPFPRSGLLSHFTNSRPMLPFLSVDVTSRFRGAVRWQSGHLLIGTTPYRGHERWEETELDIPRRRCRTCSPEKKTEGDEMLERWRECSGAGTDRGQRLSSTTGWVPRYEVDIR